MSIHNICFYEEISKLTQSYYQILLLKKFSVHCFPFSQHVYVKFQDKNAGMLELCILTALNTKLTTYTNQNN